MKYYIIRTTFHYNESRKKDVATDDGQINYYVGEASLIISHNIAVGTLFGI